MERFDRLSHFDFRRLAKFIQENCGIKTPDAKKVMVEGRLRRRVLALGMPNLTRYCEYLFDEGGLRNESVHLIDAITTNKTDFFREPEHFRILAQRVVPELLAGHGGAMRSPIKVWSAACSTGAEPYTIAMTLAEAARSTRNLRFSILGTDICTEALEIAAQGIYPASMIEPVPLELRKRHLLRATAGALDRVRIAPELRQTTRFGYFNLMDKTYPVSKDMHAIFCRNVLIYFDKPTQAEVLRRLCSHLKPGGYLFLGHSEANAGFGLPLTPVAAAVFRR